MIPKVIVATATVGIFSIVYFISKFRRSKKECSFCSIDGSHIGKHGLIKVSDTKLRELLNSDKKVAARIKSQNDRLLREHFNLGDGSNGKNFNYLAIQKLASDRNRGGPDITGLSMKYVMYINVPK